MVATSAAVAVLAVTLAVLLMWQRPKMIRIPALLMVVTSVCMAGVFGGWLHRFFTWLVGLFGSATASLFGAAAGAVLAIALLVWFVLQMDKRGKPPTRKTVIAALFIAPAFAVIPGRVGAEINQAVDKFNAQAAHVVGSWFGGEPTGGPDRPQQGPREAGAAGGGR